MKKPIEAAMRHLLMVAVVTGVVGISSVQAETLSAVGGETMQRAQAPGVVGPRPEAERVAQRSEEQAAQAPKTVATDPETSDAPEAGVPLKVRAVAVIRGKSVERALSDLVRNAVEDVLAEDGTIGSDELDRQLIAIRQSLINQGYYLSRILRVGPKGGVTAEGILPLHLQIGTVQEIEIAFKGKDAGEDGTYFTHEQIQERFAGVKEGDGFNYGKLYMALYGLNAHPDLTADVNVGVSAGTAEEGDSTAKFRLEVEEQMPLHGSLEVNNYAVDAVDNWQAVAMVQYLNLTGADDTLTFSPAMSLNGDQWSLAANYTRPFSWARGGSFSLWGGYSDTDVDDMDAGDLRDLVYSANGWFVGAQMNFNLIDTSRHNLQAYMGIQYRLVEQDMRWLGYRFSDYQVGVLPLTVGLNYTNRTQDALGGRNFANLSVTHNLQDNGDKIRKIWVDSETHYTILRAQLARIQPLFGEATLEQGYDAQWTLFTRLEGQWSNQSLIAHEQVLLGGAHNLRGYRVNGYAGDRGIYGTVEFRTPIWRDIVADLFRETPEDPDAWIDSLQLLAFVDYGWLDRERTRYSQDDAQFLWSVGLGARLALTEYLTLNADMAFPLRDLNENANEESNIEGYIGIRAQF